MPTVKGNVVDLFLSAAASALLSMDMVLVLIASDWNGDSSVVESLRVFNAKNKQTKNLTLRKQNFDLWRLFNSKSRTKNLLRWGSEYQKTQIWIGVRTKQQKSIPYKWVIVYRIQFE